MEISPRKASRRAQEPVDEWLQGQGFFRKHAPRDPTCLFRAVSEQVYLTQYYHLRVRKECVEFMANNRHMFEEYIKAPFESHLEQMAYFTEWGGMNEIQAMSLLYKKEFVVFNGQKQVRRTVTNNGFKDAVYLCHTPQKQYESVYTRNFAATAAHCQSIVYQTLYKDVFKMNNVETTVNKMLHDRNTVFRHHKFFLKGNLEVRDQLTVELYNRLDSDTNENENTQYVQKTKPPFPYRVAKALDPNIYRNIEFDIWHEIRREVKSAGWNRHNSHELQVGGKCLVQIQFNDEEYDKANNNSLNVYSSEMDDNGNETKLVQKRAKSPVFFCGHIQEMSKNQGPVLVFIEELGEKKSVPYSALKPLPLKKNRLQFVPIYQRNIQINSSQKWKKGCNSNSKKIKETVTAINVLPNSYEKNDNRNNNVSNINKKCYSLNQWNEDSLNVDHRQTYEHYPAEKYNNFAMNNSSDVFDSTIMIEENDAPTKGSNQDLEKDARSTTSSFANLAIENGDTEKDTKVAQTNTESSGEFNSPTKEMPQKDAYYPPYSENTSSSTSNTNPTYAAPGGNTFNHTDRMLRAINCSASKSVDANGHDLPLSDPLTLRFFYNLGLEYFHAYNTWSYPPNGQSVEFGQWYQGAPPNEAVTNLANGVQDCNIKEKSEEQSNNPKSDKCLVAPETQVKTVSVPKDTHSPRNETPRSEPARESYTSRERPKDYVNGNKESVRMHRNSLAPRFKRNADYRNRNVGQSTNSLHQQTSIPHHNRGPNGPNGYQRQQEPRNDNVNSLNSGVASQPVHLPVSPTAYPPYMQQGVCVPYYGTETDAFGNPYYPPSPGFFPVPCIPHSEVHDNSNIPPFQSHVYPGMDYTQGFPGVCSPFMCPPPSPCMTPQNIPEHWYALPGQPQFMQFTPVVQVSPESPCNMQNQGPNLTGSS